MLGDKLVGEVGGALAKSAVQGATSVVSNAYSQAFRGGSFDDLFSAEARAGYISGMAGTFATGVLSGSTFGMEGSQAGQVKTVAGFGGSLASMGVEYAMTGSTSVNVLNWSDFGSDASYGLFSLTLGGEDGIRAAISSSGHDMSRSRLEDVAAGFESFAVQQRIRAYDNFSNDISFGDEYDGYRSVAAALRSQYSFGNGKAQDQLSRLLSGEDKLEIGMTGGATGHTRRGDNGRIVGLATLGIKGDRNSQLRAGVVLQHEAYRDGYDGTQAQQQAETNYAVAGHAGIAWRMAQQFGTGFLEGDAAMMESYEAFDEMVRTGDSSRLASHAGNFDSSSDYWLVTADGKFQYDGQANLVDEDGNILISWEAMGLEGNDDILGSFKQLLNIEAPDNVRGDQYLEHMVRIFQETGGQINAPIDMLFLLGSENEYNILADRGELTVLSDGLAGRRGRTRTLSYNEWMAGRTSDSIMSLIDQNDPEDISPWSNYLAPDGFPTCTHMSGWRFSDVMTGIMGISDQDFYTSINEKGMWRPIRDITNGNLAEFVSSELAGNDFGTVVAMMGLGDGVNTISAEDIVKGLFNSGAIMTIWDERNYNEIKDSQSPTEVVFGHTGGNGGAVVEGYGTNQERITLNWMDQYHGTGLNQWQFYTDDSEGYWRSEDRANFNSYRNWNETQLLGTNVYNDITAYQFELALYSMKTQLLQNGYNRNNFVHYYWDELW